MSKKAKPSKRSRARAPAKRKPGRPEGQGFIASAEQRNLVEAMAGMIVPDDEICRLVMYDGKPISESTLKNHFRAELNQGRAKIRMRHHMALFKAVESGNVTAQIWWDKTRNKINERAPAGVQVNVSQQSVAAAEVSALEPEKRSMLEIGRRIAFTLALAAEQQKKPPGEHKQAA